MGITPINTSYPNPAGASLRPPLTPWGQSVNTLTGPTPDGVNPALLYRQDTRPAPVTELLADPITRKKYGLSTPFDDTLLRLSPWGKLKLSAHETFVKLPQTLYHGLRGDQKFTFSNFLNVTSIPYYAGGLVLALSFRAGRANFDFARQMVGVGLYYLGTMGANKGIESFYKAKTGVDLNLRFRKANGDVERVFASTDFPRFDLLESNDYRRMMTRLGVPDDVSDPKREVQDRVRTIISAARADKLILGNILAAVGAGYIARSDAWASVVQGGPGGWGNLKNIWNLKNKLEGGPIDRLANTGSHVASKLAEPFKEAFFGKANTAGMSALDIRHANLKRYGVWGTVGTLGAMILAHSWIASRLSRKTFESPFITNLSPALAPEQSAVTAAIQQQLPGGPVDKLPRKGVFEVAQRLESGQASPAQESVSSQGVPTFTPLGASGSNGLLSSSDLAQYPTQYQEGSVR